MGWKEDARRLTVSDKKELTTLKGYWVKVKMWSITGKDEISAVTKIVQKGLDKKALMSFAQKARKKGVDITDESEILDLLTTEEITVFIDAESSEVAKLIETKLRLGIAEHNFDGMTTEELATDLLEFPLIANEILALIEEFNRPLAKATSKKLGMSQSGSITEPASTTETPCQTEASQPN